LGEEFKESRGGLGVKMVIMIKRNFRRTIDRKKVCHIGTRGDIVL